MPIGDPADPDETARAWGMPADMLRYSSPQGNSDEVTAKHDSAGDRDDEPTRLIPVVPASGGHARQVWIIGMVAAAGVVVVIALGFLLLGPQRATAPPLIPITSVTTPSVSPTLSPSPSPSFTETVTETVTATTYVPVPTVTPTTDAPPTTTTSNPDDIWRTCRQMHPHRWCNGYR